MFLSESSRDFFGKAAIFLICVLCVIAPAYYLNLIAENTVNAPCWDDYDTLLQFLNNFLDTDSTAGRITIVFIQHIEHRLALLHLAGLSVFYLKGDLDFKFLCYIGNAALALLAFFLFYTFKTGRDFKLFYFLPAVFLLFQPQYYDTILWPTALFSNLYVLLFALVTLVLIERKGRIAFIFAVLFSVLTLLSQGNGILIFPVGLFVLFLQRSYRRGALWILISGLVLGAYFAGYTQMPGQPGILDAFINLKTTILYTLCFIGSAPGFSSFYPSLFCGIGIVLYFVFLTVTKYYKDNPVLYCFTLFVLFTIGINALFRSWRGVEFVLSQSRYKFFSVSLVILIYLSLYEKIQQRRFHLYVALGGLIAAMTFFIVSVDLYGSKVVGNSEKLRRGLVRWYVDGRGLRYPFIGKASKILKESIEKNVYRYPDNILQEFRRNPHVFRKDEINGNVESFIDTIAESDEYLYIDGWAFHQMRSQEKQETLIVLRSPENILSVPTAAIRRPDLGARFPSRNLEQAGFGVLISKKMIQPGRYEVGIYIEGRGEDKVKNGLWFSGKFVEIKK